MQLQATVLEDAIYLARHFVANEWQDTSCEVWDFLLISLGSELSTLLT